MKAAPLILAMFLGASQAVKHHSHKVSNESRDIINNAVGDVLHITGA